MNKRHGSILLALILWAIAFSGKSSDALPEHLLTSSRWNLRYEGLDANHNRIFDKEERRETDARENIYYEFEEGGKGKYNNAAYDGQALKDITWSLADSNRKLTIVMSGNTYNYRIQTLTGKKLVIATSTTDGRGFEEYSHK